MGEASVNFYYTVMSIYGWMMWSKRDVGSRPVLHITTSSRKEWMKHLVFFVAFYFAIFFALTELKKKLCTGCDSLGRCIC